jgi:hypothetical protein
MCALISPSCWPALESARAEDVAQPSAAEVKAALLFNFARYIEWPKSFLPDQAEEIIFGVFGDSEDARTIERMVTGKTIAGRRIALKTFYQPDEITPTHILFISLHDPSLVGRILEKVPNYVVTVGDLPGFLKLGGMINFTKSKDNIRFELNQKAVDLGGIKISAALTRLADAVIK